MAKKMLLEILNKKRKAGMQEGRKEKREEFKAVISLNMYEQP